MGDSANPEVQVELSDLSFTRAEKTSTTSGVQELVGWNGCESRGSDWKVKAGTPYKRNSNHQLTAEGKTLEKLADCGAPLNLIPDRDCSSDKLSPRMARFLDEHLFSCVKQAAHASGLKEEPKRVFVITGECFIDRKMRGGQSNQRTCDGKCL